MPFEPITLVDDPRIAVYRDLPRSNLTRPSGLFIAEGWLLVERLLASRYPVESVLLDERFVDELAPRLPLDRPIYVIPRALVNDVVGFKFHRGVLACGRRLPSGVSDDWLVPPAARKTIVVAVDINDPENMGCILRNSAAFGADLVVASRSCADPFSRRVLRTSMGTVLHLSLVQPFDLAAELTRLQAEHGFEFAATALDPTAEPLQNATRGNRFGLVFGNEGHGLGAEVIACCRRRVTIPMHGGTDSLNVGVASGIFLYHFCR